MRRVVVLALCLVYGSFLCPVNDVQAQGRVPSVNMICGDKCPKCGGMCAEKKGHTTTHICINAPSGGDEWAPTPPPPWGKRGIGWLGLAMNKPVVQVGEATVRGKHVAGATALVGVGLALSDSGGGKSKDDDSGSGGTGDSTSDEVTVTVLCKQTKKPLAGVPVYVGGLRVGVTDGDGKVTFTRYRKDSSFEVYTEDTATHTGAGTDVAPDENSVTIEMPVK